MLELQNISFVVDNKQILRSLNLEIRAGSFVAITGPNGSGKTSIAKIIMGITSPTEGNVLFENKDITKLSVDQRAKQGISFAFQAPVRFKGISVREMLCYAAGRNLRHSEINEYLTRVGLSADEYINRELGASLSGGEIKRIELAMLLVQDAKLMLFDEPEAGVDLWSFEHVAQIFKSLKKENKTVLVVTHQKRVLEMADEIIILDKGKISRSGKPKELLPKILENKNAK